jgi:hypothetical protein
MTLLSALKALGAIPQSIAHGHLAAPIDPSHELRKLHKAVDELKKSVANLPPPNTGKIEQMVERYRNAGGILSEFKPYEIRLLTWNRDLLADERFRFQLAEYVRTGEVKPNLMVLSKVYFAEWGRHSHPEIFEQILKIVAHSQKVLTPLLELYKKHAGELFSSRADSFLGTRFLSDSKTCLADTFAEWEIPATTPLAAAVIENISDRMLAQYGHGNHTGIGSLLDALSLPAASSKTLQKAVERLILNEETERNLESKSAIEGFVVGNRRLGDPRLQHNLPNWVGIDSAAQRKFKSWRTVKDLSFFFNSVLPQGKDPHGRKHFWLNYVDQVEDSVVALCQSDLIRLSLTLSKEHIQPCTASGENGVSCFMMRFRSGDDAFVVTEFSGSGMVRFFPFDAFVKNVGSLHKNEFKIKQLKSDSGLIEGISHMNGWDIKTRRLLARLGVRPR